jgi:hypothetical protein
MYVFRPISSPTNILLVGAAIDNIGLSPRRQMYTIGVSVSRHQGRLIDPILLQLSAPPLYEHIYGQVCN